MLKILFSLALLGLGGLIVYIMSLREVVPTNEVHIVQSRNRTVAYGKNTKIGNVYWKVPPFVPYWGVTVTKLPSTILNISFSNFTVRDSNMIPFVIEMRAYAVIEDYVLAATRIFTMNELKEHLTGVLQSHVRKIFAERTLKDILERRIDLGATITEACVEEFKLWGTAPLGQIEINSIGDYKEYNIISSIEKAKIDNFVKEWSN